MNKIKIDNYYKPESKTLRLDEVDYTIIPNSDIKPLLDKLEQENKILKENAEHNDKVVDKVNWENQLLKKENKQLKDELKSKPDAQITLQDDKGNKFMVIQTERIDMQVELNKTIEKLFNNWNKLKEWVNKHYDYYINNEDYVGGRLCFTDMKNKIKELEENKNE